MHLHFFFDPQSRLLSADLSGSIPRNHKQLQLKFKLYLVEVLFNKRLSLIYLSREEAGMGDLAEASADKVTAEHGVIDEGTQDRGEGYTVFSIVCPFRWDLFLREVAYVVLW